MQTKLFETVCKRAALMRAPYAQSSWTNNTSTIKKNHHHENIINDIYMQLIQLLDINENGRLVLPFSRRLILIDRPRVNLHQNAGHIHNNKCTQYESQQYELSTSSSESYLTSADENNSEHNSSFPSISLPPSPFICDPYESYDWEC
ncbi:unnamed protein product [Rotaria sp. Silwood1]|nr:unnamed protein product [Rotaria sp. Silwood1]CAF1665979.1 unnamed protein product [Rotaria sp. Silwood1]